MKGCCCISWRELLYTLPPPTLPHFCNLLIAFFKGAAQTWERFTSEFAPGGLIDEATAEERELAHMPAANDENEGLLGSF